MAFYFANCVLKRLTIKRFFFNITNNTNAYMHLYMYIQFALTLVN